MLGAKLPRRASAGGSVSTALDHVSGQRATGGAAREDAPAEEGALQRVVAVHAAAAEARDLPVSSDDLALDMVEVQFRSPGDLVHAQNEVAQTVTHDEVDAVSLESLDRCGGARCHAARGELHVLSCQVGVLLGARQRELL